MNNIIVIAYNGKKPTQQQIESISQRLATLKCCDEIEIIQHYDKKSIVDIVGKGTTIIGFEQDHSINEALKNAATFMNAHFGNNVWNMAENVGIANKALQKSASQTALLNAVDIIAKSSEEDCMKYGISENMYKACHSLKYYVLE